MRPWPPWLVAGGVLVGGLAAGYFAAEAAARRQGQAAEAAAREPASTCAGNLELLLARQDGAASTLAGALSWGGAAGFRATAAALDLGDGGAALLLRGDGGIVEPAALAGGQPIALGGGETSAAATAPGQRFGTTELGGIALALSLAPASEGRWVAIAVSVDQLLTEADCLGVPGGPWLAVVLPDLERGGLRPLARAPADPGRSLLRLPVRTAGRNAMVVSEIVSGSGRSAGLLELSLVLSLLLAVAAYWQAGSSGRLAAEIAERDQRLREANGRWTEEAERRTALESLLERRSQLDPLTLLSSREEFLRRLGRALSRVRGQADDAVAVLFVGIDRFKNVNESLGHMAGDRVLAEVGRRLGAAVQPGDETARIGGDRFAALLHRVDGPDPALRVAQRLHDGLRSAPIDIDGHEIFVSVSVGVAVPGDGLEEADELLTRAEMAMHHAKEGGSGRSLVFQAAMELRAGSRLQLESDLRRAISAEQFDLHFQPIVSLAHGSTEGMEALLRWRHPVDGVVSPDRFIALAEETGLVVPLTRWVLTRAVRTLRRWRELGGPAARLYVSVNLSSRDFDEPDLCDYVRELLGGGDLEPGALRIELTEGAVLGNFELAARRLGELHAMEIPLLLDDFGTGYSSLSYLHQLPFDFVKIDRSFVRRMAGPSGDTEMVRTIVQLARHMAIGSVAEGVETELDEALLREVGCQYGQGYLYSPALPEAEALRLATAGAPSGRSG